MYHLWVRGERVKLGTVVLRRNIFRESCKRDRGNEELTKAFFRLIIPACAIPMAGVCNITKAVHNNMNPVSPELGWPGGSQFAHAIVQLAQNDYHQTTIQKLSTPWPCTTHELSSSQHMIRTMKTAPHTRVENGACLDKLTWKKSPAKKKTFQNLTLLKTVLNNE